MLTEERKAYILKELAQRQTIKTSDLVLGTKASESTIRRDLKELEQEGQLKRIHGGASTLLHLNTELSMVEKADLYLAEKKAIARAAAHLIEPNDVVYLDAGSTTYEMLPFILRTDIRIVTNSILHAHYLAQHQIPTIMIGGRLKLSTQAIIGSEGVKQLGQYHFSKAFMGMNGVHHQYGFTTPDEEEAMVKATAMRQASQCFILADHSKFEALSFAKVSNLEDGKIITNRLPKKWHTLYQDTTVTEVRL